MEQLLRPTQYLRLVQQHFPQLGRDVDTLRAKRGKGLPAWPDWCFLPLAGAAALVAANPLGATKLRGPAIGIVGAVAAWRATQGVYRLDPAMFDALWQTPLTGKLPSTLFSRLPEWCCYIQCPTPVALFRPKPGTPPAILLHGWFVHLEWDAKEHHTELRLALDIDDAPDSIMGLLPYALHIGDWDLEESIRISTQYALREIDRYDVTAAMLDVAGRQAAKEALGDLSGSGFLAAVLAPIISVTLYLCSVNADISGRVGAFPPERPPLTRTKHGPRLFPPSQPQVWDVGFRMGAALRAGTHVRTSTDPLGNRSHHAPPRVHIRRSHWHLFWTGKGRTVPLVRWLHPILVGGNTEDLIASVHTVEGETP
jgi:hypothetical protein